MVPANETTIPYQEYLPAPRLRPYVLLHWAITAPAAAVPKHIRVLPDGCMDLILDYGDGIFPAGCTQPPGPKAFLCGPDMQPMLLDMPGRIDIVGIRFRPGGAFPFLKLPCNELAGKQAPMELMGSALAARLRDYAAEAATPKRRAALLDTLLLECLPDSTPDPRLPCALRLLHKNSKGTAKTAAEMGLQRRGLERLFSRHVGISPGDFRRMLRMQHALQLLRLAPPDLCTTAHTAGYCDQSHFNREIKMLTGTTPSSLRREWLDDAFVQYVAPPLW